MFSDSQNYQINEQNYSKINGENVLPKETTEEKNPLQCNICGLIISNKWNFTLHMRVHNNDRRYKCKLCPSSFITSYDLKRHALAHEGMRPRFKCQFCPKTYASRHSRYLHEDSHNQLEYKCRHCPEIFTKFVDRKKHEKDYHLNDNVFFNCSECNKKFTSKRFLENHEKNYHKKEENGFKCEECGVLFETSVNLNIHRRTHVNKTIIINETDPSGTQSSKVKTLKKKRPIELFGIRIHECIICTKRYTSRGDMLSHMSSNHPEENKAIFKFPCNICNKAFKCKQGLSQHLITHNGEKKYSCELCDYKSKRIADLKVHMRKHTGEAPYVCDKCGRRFQQVKSFQHHKRQHFGKVFKCDLCEASFYRNRELDWHKQKHSQGGFKCFKCDKMLANPYSLKSHLRIGECVKKKGATKRIVKSAKRLGDNVLKIKIGNDKCYECFVCGFSSLSSLDMTKHQITHKAKIKLKDVTKEVLAEEKEIQPQRLSDLRKILNGSVQKTDYKGVITAVYSSHHTVSTSSLSSSSILFSPIEDTFKVPDTLSVLTSSLCPSSNTQSEKTSVVCIDGRTFCALDELKRLDAHSLIQYIKNCG